MPLPPIDPKKEETIFPEEEFSMEGYDKHIRNARITLFIIAALQLVPVFVMGNLNSDARAFVIGVSVLTAVVFAGLAYWTRFKPFTALLIALIVYIGIILVNVVLGGIGTILQGLVLKVIIVMLLILGLKNAKEAEDMKKMYGK